MHEKEPTHKRVYIVAGEASGDLIGSKLIYSLKKHSKHLQFRGVGGAKMKEAGLHSIFNIVDLSIIGFLEIIPSIPRIVSRLNTTIQDISNYKPDIVITIDSPGFNFRLAKKLRKKFGKAIKIVHYVAPSVWAYKPERVHVVKELFDHLLCILPMEQQYFDKVSMSTTYIGHPILEDKITRVKSSKTILTVMPGSRLSEVKSHLPIFKNAIDQISKTVPKLEVFIPTLPNLKKYITDSFKGFANVTISDDSKVKDEHLRKSSVAMVKSGTSSMEMLKYNVPTVVGYKINSLSAWYLKRKLKIKYASIVNIILNKEVIKEYLQEKLTPKALAAEVLKLLTQTKYRTKQLAEYKKARDLLIDNNKTNPSDLAAKIVLNMIE